MDIGSVEVVKLFVDWEDFGVIVMVGMIMLVIGEDICFDYGIDVFFFVEGNGLEIEWMDVDWIRFVVVVIEDGCLLLLWFLVDGKLFKLDEVF